MGDKRFRAAVGEDVADLAASQVPVDRDDVEPGLHGREVHRERVDGVGRRQLTDLVGVTRGDHHHRHPGGFPDGDLLAHVIDVADDDGVVDELVGDDLGRFVLAARAEQPGDVVDDLRVAHPAVDVGVEVGVFGAHPTHVQRQERFDAGERRGTVVGDDHLGACADLAILPAAPGTRSREALVEPFAIHSGQPRRVEDRQPAVADFGGQRDVLRPFGAQHHRDVGAQRMDDRLERFTQAGGAHPGQRQRIVRACAGHRLPAGPHLAQDVDVFPGARQRLGKPLPVPPLHHLRAGHAEPEDVPAPGQVVEGERGHRTSGRGARRQLHHRGAQPQPLRRRTPPRQRGVGVRSPGLGGEDRVEAGLLGGDDQFTGARRRLCAPISQLQSKLHRRLLGRFFTALRERRVVGVRGSDGRVHVPPVEYDPVSHEQLTEMVPVDSVGTVVSWTWQPAPRNQPQHRPRT
jgi:hypothetical protein